MESNCAGGTIWTWPAVASLCIVMHCILGLFISNRAWACMQHFPVLLHTTGTLNSILGSCVWHKQLMLALSGVILPCEWSCEWVCPAFKNQTLKYTFAECFSAWAKLVPKQEWGKRKKPIFRLFLSAAVSHRFPLKKRLQLSIRASQQQRLEAERGLGEGFHSHTGPDPLNNKAKWVKAKDMLTEASWTVPSSVPEACSVYPAFCHFGAKSCTNERRVTFSNHALLHQKT